MRPNRVRLKAYGLPAGMLLLAACATAPVAPPPAIETPVDKTAPGRAVSDSFAAAVARGLPVTVGVYGVVAESSEADEVPRPFDSDSPVDQLPAVPGIDSPLVPKRARPGEPNLVPEGVSVNIGAGFLFDTTGLIVTAAHVVTGTSSIVVKMTDRRVFRAELIGRDAGSDIALIRIPASSTVAPWFGLAQALEPGDWVLAIGDPYGLNRSVSAGVVGGGARHFAEDRDALFIQSDLALNPGNSGGPLLNADGAIVGMNLRMMIGPFGTAGVSLSMPIELVLRIAQDLKDGRADTRPRLGAKFEDVSPPAAIAAGRLLADGALVTAVSVDSVADRIGLRVDDIVVGFNGHPLGDSADLVRALLTWHAVVGTRITVFRDRAYHELTLRQVD